MYYTLHVRVISNPLVLTMARDENKQCQLYRGDKVFKFYYYTQFVLIFDTIAYL